MDPLTLLLIAWIATAPPAFPQDLWVPALQASVMAHANRAGASALADFLVRERGWRWCRTDVDVPVRTPEPFEPPIPGYREF